jgi:hypothetical protein
MSALGQVRRVTALAVFLLSGLTRSWAVVVPLGGAAVFYSLAFKYALDAGQYRFVMATWRGGRGGGGARLWGGRADRAQSYTLVARLPRRAELLGAVVLAAWWLALVVGVALTLVGWLQDRVSLSDVAVLSTLGTCALLPLAGAAAGLHLTRLVNRGGSQLISYLLLIAVLLIADQRWVLVTGRYRRAVGVYDRLVWPLGTLLKGVGRDVSIQRYLLAAAIVVGALVLVLALAVELFRRKDLIWIE